MINKPSVCLHHSLSNDIYCLSVCFQIFVCYELNLNVAWLKPLNTLFLGISANILLKWILGGGTAYELIEMNMFLVRWFKIRLCTYWKSKKLSYKVLHKRIVDYCQQIIPSSYSFFMSNSQTILFSPFLSNPLLKNTFRSLKVVFSIMISLFWSGTLFLRFP